jgi:Phosphoesterase family
MKSALALLLAASGVLAAPYPIKHVVILMAENRAFDHMLASALGNETTTATNPVNVTNPSQGIMRFLPNAPCTSEAPQRAMHLPPALRTPTRRTFLPSPPLADTVGDPDHSVPGTSLQVRQGGPARHAASQSRRAPPRATPEAHGRAEMGGVGKEEGGRGIVGWGKAWVAQREGWDLDASTCSLYGRSSGRGTLRRELWGRWTGS